MKNFLKKLKYIFEYIIFYSAQKILLLFGFETAANICSCLARKIGPYLKVSNVARNNLRKILGSHNQEQILDEVWDNFGRFIGEFPYINKLSIKEIEQRINIEGIEHLTEFNLKNQPFLVFTGHFSNWDFILKLISKLYPKFGIVYRKTNNPYVNQALIDSRTEDNIHLIAKGPSGVKDLIKAIKNDYSIAMLVDQKMNDGIEVPFFGFPAMTSYAIAKFALQYNYPIVPVQNIRQKRGKFKVIIHPPLKYEKTNDKEQDYYNIMLKINQILESWIRQNPGQWFWFHNRWK